jgi:hypothetical protein
MSRSITSAPVVWLLERGFYYEFAFIIIQCCRSTGVGADRPWHQLALFMGNIPNKEFPMGKVIFSRG